MRCSLLSGLVLMALPHVALAASPSAERSARGLFSFGVQPTLFMGSLCADQDELLECGNGFIGVGPALGVHTESPGRFQLGARVGMSFELGGGSREIAVVDDVAFSSGIDAKRSVFDFAVEPRFQGSLQTGVWFAAQLGGAYLHETPTLSSGQASSHWAPQLGVSAGYDFLLEDIVALSPGVKASSCARAERLVLGASARRSGSSVASPRRPG